MPSIRPAPPNSFHEAHDEVISLIGNFQKSEGQHFSAEYTERQVREDYLNKFFWALGWDVYHDLQTNPNDQEVRVEHQADSVSNRRADYAFFLRPDLSRPAFLVEAKRPLRDLARLEFYYQTARYGRSANNTVAVLTDFSSFHIIDCRRLPDKVEGLIEAIQIQVFDYTDFLDPQKFGEFYYRFSRQAVADGLLKQYWKSLPPVQRPVKQLKLKLFRDTGGTIDESFVSRLDTYRGELADAIFKSNPELNAQELTEATQRILDRLVFIRFLEDKMIEPNFIVNTFAESANPWRAFVLRSRLLDEKYNGAVFKEHFIDRRTFFPPRHQTFTQICEELDYENSPILSYIPVEILGAIYERFLGKVVEIEGKKARIVEKPEVRNAGGVFYTPQYIVDYIVEHTIGGLLEGKTPDDISALKIADISCGSGSFLISVFGRIIRHLENWYNAHPAEARRTGCRFVNGNGVRWVLSLDQKKQVLRNNIFGVDIDNQAVEVAQLSLFLKLLDAESLDSTQIYQTEISLEEEKQILPDLTTNIRWGNSLVEPDIILNSEEIITIRPFTFDRFNLLREGKFDAIVGNPPWGSDLSPIRKYLERKYLSGKKDSAAIFFERGLDLCSQSIGLIVPKTICYYNAWEGIRKHLLQNANLQRVLDAGIAFPEVNLESVALVFNKSKITAAQIDHAIPLKKPEVPKTIVRQGTYDLKVARIANVIPFIALTKDQARLLLRLNKTSVKLGVVAEGGIYRGIYIPDSEKRRLRDGQIPFINKVPDVTKYHIERVRNINLGANKKRLDRAEKVMVPRLFLKVLRGKKIVAFPDPDGKFLTTEKLVNVVVTSDSYSKDYYYLTGILNSNVPSFYLQKALFSDTTETSRVMDDVYAGQIPLPKLDLSEPSQKKSHDLISESVRQLIRLKNDLVYAHSDSDKIALEDQCLYHERRIDTCAEILYGITQSESAILSEWAKHPSLKAAA